MIIKQDEKKQQKFKKDSDRKKDERFKYFCMYIQMAEVCDNGLTLSRQPWRWKEFHKLTGDRNNQYAFGISKKDRTICFGNDRKPLSLHEVTVIEIANYSEDYH